MSEQQQRILNLLRANDWVPLPAILSLYIASYTRRIHELRKRGFVIEMQKCGHHTKYSLISEPETKAVL